jgi:hypothetical protein
MVARLFAARTSAVAVLGSAASRWGMRPVRKLLLTPPRRPSKSLSLLGTYLP